jgi:hypothetical protein
MFKLNSVTRGAISTAAVLLVSVATMCAQQPPAPRTIQAAPAATEALGRATTLISSGNLAEAATVLETALKADPDYPGTLQELVWIRATSPDPKVRNPKEAVQLGGRLVDQTNYKGRATEATWSKALRIKSLYQLTVAYIAAGNMDQAALHAQLVLETATRFNETQKSPASEELLKAAQTTKQAIDGSGSTLAVAAMRSMGAGCAQTEPEVVARAFAAASTPPLNMAQFPKVTVPLTQ